MIRINLLPRKAPSSSDLGKRSLLLGLVAILVAGALLFFFVHVPLADEVDELSSSTQSLEQDKASKEKDLKGYKELKDAVKLAEERKKIITRLNDARANPAHLLYELSSILTLNRTPTMTRAMSQQVRENPNRDLATDWDPKHVWITRFSEKGGEFRLEGGAQSDGDMTQLALRLQASVYFRDVVPEGGAEAVDKNSGLSYYQFTIVGRVAY